MDGRRGEKEMREPLLRKESVAHSNSASAYGAHHVVAVSGQEGSLGSGIHHATADPSELSDLEFLQQYVNVQRAAAPPEESHEDVFDMTAALQRCQNTVVRPITWLLRILAWTHIEISRPTLNVVVNVVYPLCILALILYSYAYDILVCREKRDEGSTVCSNIISKYIVPDIVHFISFAYAMYYFRRMSGFEHLTSLIETVFLRSTENSYQTLYGDLSQSKLVHTLRAYIVVGSLWIACRIVYNVLQYVFVAGTDFTTGVRAWLIVVQIFATAVADSTYVALVVNYAIQCRLLLFYTDGLRHRLTQRQLTLNGTIQEVVQLQRWLRNMNRGIGYAIGMSAFMFVTLTVTPVVTILDGDIQGYTNMGKALTILDLVLWLLILFGALLQAARVSSKGRSLRESAVIMRNEGYRKATQADLDSFILFVSHVEFKAKIVAVPITPALLSKLVFVFLVTALIMFQVGIVKFWI